jgi:transmembrane sensor
MTLGDDLPEPTRETWDVDAMWSRVRARTLDAPEEAPGRRAAEAGVEHTGTPWAGRIAVAASLAIIAGSGALIVRARLAPPAESPAAGRYSTSRGQYATVKLADGSEVTLAPESRLTIAADFSRGAREIVLDGEAIFSVRHDAARPFKVSAGDAVIVDVGTRFDVRAYDADAAVTVAVVEGSVSLGAALPDSLKRGVKPLVLAAGDVGTLDGRSAQVMAKRGVAAAYLAWANGTLSFVDRPLPEVLRAIERWHDVEVRIAGDALATRLVTAEFSRQSASEMLDALAIALNAIVERNGRVITLRPR